VSELSAIAMHPPLSALLLLLCLATSDAHTSVVVTGATGRVGRLVVERLLARDSQTTVHAVARDAAAARAALPASDALKIVELDLATEFAASSISSLAEGVDAVIWCASGFKPDGVLIDMDTLPACAKGLCSTPSESGAPKLVLCSSAGVTRPAWPPHKQEALVGASDIPIIRLNPGNILNQKCSAEQQLRESGVPYCIVRPTGLKDDWPSGRPILSQGDVAVGRTAPADLAAVLCGVLDEPSAAGKTFEMFTLTGYPAGPLAGGLEALAPDTSPPCEASVEATYRLLQQMLPGEQQDATKLEMGRTYEQVDRGEVAARERGAEATERELEVAGGALEGMGRGGGTKRGGLLSFFGIGTS